MRTIHSNSLILPPLSIAILVSSYSIGFTKSERMSTRIKSYVHGNTGFSRRLEAGPGTALQRSLTAATADEQED